MTIIVKILGGMGNQMFQYAAAKSLALKLKTELVLDTESLQRHGERPFDLNHFSLTDKIADTGDFQKIGWSFLSYPLARLKIHPNYYLEKEFTYNPNSSEWKAPLYLDGYFQSEKYFDPFHQEIRALFQFKAPLNENEKKYQDLIKITEAVSLHIRRGDYVTNPKATTQMGILPLDYYQKAMSFIEKKIANPTYFIFSDDPEWVTANLKMTANHYFVTGNTGKESFRDMRLMSWCKHHIVANSSFSWWGAWLNPSLSKIVIAPKEWFRDGTDDRDLVLSSWIRL